MHVVKPHGAHKKFRLIHGIPRKTVDSPELDAVNVEFLAGNISFARAHILISDLARTLRPKRLYSWLPENEKLARDYWEARIKPKKGNVAPWEAKRRIFWAIHHLGATSLLTGTTDGIDLALAHLSPKQRNRCASVLNAILRWKGLDTYISSVRVTRDDPQYLTYKQLMSVSLPKREWQLCVLAAFATGARYGELFCMSPTTLRSNGTHIFIARQLKMDPKGEMYIDEVKNRMAGTAFIVPELRTAVKEWTEVPDEIKRGMRENRLPSKAFKALMFKLFRKEMTFHNLRHSYAKCMLSANEGEYSKRADLPKLKVWMRDRQTTIETYYVAWVETDAEMESNVEDFMAKKKA